MNKTLKLYFILNALVWLGYAAVCIVYPALLADLGVFPQADWVAQVEVRAMYGGAQFAIGLFALAALLKPVRYAEGALLFLCLLFAGLALVRLSGLLLDAPGLWADFSDSGSPATYNAGALWFFEMPMLLAGLWLSRASLKAPVSAAARAVT